MNYQGQQSSTPFIHICENVLIQQNRCINNFFLSRTSKVHNHSHINLQNVTKGLKHSSCFRKGPKFTTYPFD